MSSLDVLFQLDLTHAQASSFNKLILNTDCLTHDNNNSGKDPEINSHHADLHSFPWRIAWWHLMYHWMLLNDQSSKIIRQRMFVKAMLVTIIFFPTIACVTDDTVFWPDFTPHNITLSSFTAV